MAHIIVTGANGLLATNTIIDLLKNGHIVTALVRNKSKFILPKHVNLEVKEFDLFRTEKHGEIFKGGNILIHTAAETDQGIIVYNTYHETNVVGTENILKAALASQIKKFVYISTSNTLGHGTYEKPGDESHAAKKPFTDSNYVKSKIKAEELVLQYSKHFDVVILNPTFIIGAYDQKPSSGRILLSYYHKNIIFYPSGGKNFVGARDVAQAIIKAISIAKNKEQYVLAGENLSYKEFLKKINLLSNKKAIYIKIPNTIMITLGHFGNVLKYLGIKNEFHLTNMRILCTKNYYQASKAEHDFCMKFNPINTSIIEAINWFKQLKLL
ncbi:MAG: NAD-dependent epimerase/dehydratase family protein [bacterium]|nr:NAD-dependent epimerase/dehydratase family protein [bacterium]